MANVKYIVLAANISKSYAFPFCDRESDVFKELYVFKEKLAGILVELK